MEDKYSDQKISIEAMNKRQSSSTTGMCSPNGLTFAKQSS